MDSVRIILLIGDEKVSQVELSNILHGEYIVKNIDSVAAVLNEIEQHGPDNTVIMINLDMPGMKGYRILESLISRVELRTVPLIGVGQRDNLNMEASALELGAWDYIGKPYNARIVRRRLNNIIQRIDNAGDDKSSGCAEFQKGRHQLELLLSKLPCTAGVCEYRAGKLTTVAGSRIIHWLINEDTDREKAERNALSTTEFKSAKADMGYKVERNALSTTEFKSAKADMGDKNEDENVSLRREDKVCIKNALQAVINTQDKAECSFWFSHEDENNTWMRLWFRFLEKAGDSQFLLYLLSDMTDRKEMEYELRRYKTAIYRPDRFSNRILVVDDQEMNREILKEIFRNYYEVLEASNGREAIEVLHKNENDVDVILLDLMMPVMDGGEFLEYKNSHSDMEDIPVVVITADGSYNQQVNTLALGVDDYIVKPFVVEAVLRRIQNVLESHRRFREVFREYNNVLAQAREDSLTKLFNRAAAQEHINHVLRMEQNQQHALIMLDIDRFKEFNDTYGHKFGDDTLTRVANEIKDFFRDTDIVSRFGGDEFCIFMRAVSSPNMALEKCIRLCKVVRGMHMDGCDKGLSVSVGIAVTDRETRTFDALYRNADKALYTSKRNGRNQATLYKANNGTCDVEL